jgi:hypothetical protein
MKCKLPGCNKKARKKFCCNKHKDRYHNLTNPRGKFAHLHPDNMSDDDYYDATTHPFSGEALGQD